MEDNIDEIQEQQSNMVINILVELQNNDKITLEQCEDFKQKFNKLQEMVIKTYQNNKGLSTKQKKLKVELNQEKIKLEQATNKQLECQDITEKLAGNMKKAEAEVDIHEYKIDTLMMDYKNIVQEQQSRKIKIQDEQKQAQNRYEPEKLNNRNKISDIEQQIEKTKQSIENGEKVIRDNKEKIENEKIQKEEYFKEVDRLKEDLMRISEDPKQIKKSRNILQTAINNLKKELVQLEEDVEKKEGVIRQQFEENEKLNIKIQEMDSVIGEQVKEMEKHDELKKQYIEKINRCREQYMNRQEDKFILDEELKVMKMEVKRREENVVGLGKKREQVKKKFKKNQNIKGQMKDQIRELEIMKDKYVKEEKSLKNEMEKCEEQNMNIDEQNKILIAQSKRVGDKTQDKEVQLRQFEKQIKDLEAQVIELVNIEQKAKKTQSSLTTMRESMARKASGAMAEVRETREELKIKELLILDLRKKQQETELRLNSYKALYEEVKSARNKYVNMIQNSSQDLAELKERIKILGNELEILKNESGEKDRSLQEYRLILQQEIHNRDGFKTLLNKLQYERKQTYQQVDQNISEIEKLNMVIFGLEKEMLKKRKEYEVVCEDRNYAGVQLIDRNDELCILYEKSNIQQSVLTQGEAEIRRLEDEVRMVKLELKDNQRKIMVAREKVLLVPKLADDVVRLKTELNLEKEKEKQLSEQLENPINEVRWRELGGSDPEPENLEKQISVLEELLNRKKETLLEKELILDEITTLSEKLRKQAIEGRQNTLQVTEKVNEFQNRLKQITRKMMATISELSMFQATCLKLQNERDRLDSTQKEAEQRMEQNKSPFPETEIQYLKMVRDQKRHQEELDIRKQREILEKNIPPFATKTTAEHRYNSYIPDEIGLPKPYGSHAPFNPSPYSANLRFIRKPEPKEIQI